MAQRVENPAKEIEETLRRIRDVVTARVVLDEQGVVQEIHVLAGPGRGVRHILRDVESSVMAALGTSIDKRKISIAQLNSEEVPANTKRVRLLKVEIVSESESAQVNVHLGLGTNKVIGIAQGVPTRKMWLRAAAEATLGALEKLLPREVSFHIDDVNVSSTKTVRVALVTVVMTVSGQDSVLTGSCPVTHDERESIVKATLQAVNRRIAVLMGSA